MTTYPTRTQYEEAIRGWYKNDLSQANRVLMPGNWRLLSWEDVVLYVRETDPKAWANLTAELLPESA
jgi:hypothetical protein